MKAHYFCENCGKEVRAGASSCPYCGRVFKAVRCPECGYEGKASQFSAGCPACGFLEKKETAEPSLLPRTASRQSRLSARFYRIAMVVLLAVVVVLIAVLVFKG